MEALTRPAEASRAPLRVLADASMTMSFSLPASFIQKRAALASSTAIEETKEFEKTDDSWEERDWEHETPIAVKMQQIEHEEGGWEQETTPELPDDFPRLILNLSRVQRHHFPAAQEDFDMMEVFQRVRNTLHQHFSQMTEVLFEQKSCFHCTYGTSRAMMDGLHAAYPEDCFAMVDYPTEIDDVPLHEYLLTLSSPSKWKSVEYLKDCLRRCSRDIRWKRDVITELEVLAEQEFAQYEDKQQRLSDEIDGLTHLRDSFREKLYKLTSHEGKPKGQYMMLRKLEDIENRLMTLLDEYLKETELEEEECYSAFGSPGGEGGVTTGMNVLDMVIAMVFDRLPRDFSQKTTTEEHFQILFDHHIHILRLWKKDFGRLPPKSRVTVPRGDTDNAHNLSDEEQVVPASDDGEAAEYADAFSSYCRVDDGDVGTFDAATSVGIEDDLENCQIEDGDQNEPIRTEAHNDNDSDGYGADFDSDKSEDEDEQPRLRKLEEVKQSDAKKSSASIQPRRRRVKRTKRSKKLEKLMARRRYSDEEQETAPFQPFACTGAVGLLRLAKENEMF